MLLNGLYSDRFTCNPRVMERFQTVRIKIFELNSPAAIKCMCSGRWKCRVDATCPPRNQVNKVKIGTVVTPILARAQATFALTHTHPSPPWIYALSMRIGLRTPNICQFTYPKFPFIPADLPPSYIIDISSSIHPSVAEEGRA